MTQKRTRNKVVHKEETSPPKKVVKMVRLVDRKTGITHKAIYPDDCDDFEEDFIVKHAFGEKALLSVIGSRNSVPVKGTPYFFDKSCGCHRKASGVVEIFIEEVEIDE